MEVLKISQLGSVSGRGDNKPLTLKSEMSAHDTAMIASTIGIYVGNTIALDRFKGAYFFQVILCSTGAFVGYNIGHLAYELFGANK